MSEVTQSCPTLCNPMGCSLPTPPSIGFSRQEYWSGLPFPSPEALPDPGIEPAPLALVGGFFITESLGMPGIYVRVKQTMPVYVFVYSFFCAIVLEEQSEETSDLGHQD